MTRGLWRLTWLEIKIFLREPLGVLGTALPVLIFVVFGRLFGRQIGRAPRALTLDLPVFTSLLIALSAVSSLIAVIAIYREGGILRRLKATPLRPLTILTAHVNVKLLFTAATLVAMMLAGRRYYPTDADVPLVSFALALLFSTVSILSLGFLVASVVPTARFAQPVGSLVLYPMIAVSGLFVPLQVLPPTLGTVARALPFTYVVSLLRGIWRGEGWWAHSTDVAVLTIMFFLFSAASAKVFRWE